MGTQRHDSTHGSVSSGSILNLTRLAWRGESEGGGGCGSQERWAGAVWLPKRLLIHSLNYSSQQSQGRGQSPHFTHRKLKLREVKWLLAVPSVDRSRESEGRAQKNQGRLAPEGGGQGRHATSCTSVSPSDSQDSQICFLPIPTQ